MKDNSEFETAKVLKEFEKNGFDLTKPMLLDFFVVVPSKANGTDFSSEVAALGFDVNVEYDQETSEWTCYCSKKIVPELSTVVDIEMRLSQIASKHGGYTDGFGTYGN